MSKERRRGENNSSDSSTNSNSFDSGRNDQNSNRSGSSGGDGHLFFDGVDDDEEEDDSSSEEELGFFVKVETIMGNTFEIYAYPNDNVELLKTRIAFQEGILQKDQNLFLSQGRIPLNNPTALLSDLGLNEATSQFKPLRLITNISSGIGSKGYTSRDLSPPPPPFPLQLPFLPHPLSSKSTSTKTNSGTRRRRGRDRYRLRKDSNSHETASNDNNADPISGRGRRNIEARLDDNPTPEPFSLPRLDLGLEDDDIDGVLIFEGRGDRRVYFIVKKKSNEEPLSPDSSDPSSSSIRNRIPSSTTTSSLRSGRGDAVLGGIMSRRSAEAAEWILQNDLPRRREVFSGREKASGELQRQVDRVKENAKTLKKMNQIRNNLSSKKKVFLNSDYSNTNRDRDRKPLEDDHERMNHLPDINEKNYNYNFKERSNYQYNATAQGDENSKTPMSSKGKTTTNNIKVVKSSMDYNRTVTSSIASLNRLKAEIYLEAKKTGKGRFGVLPYTHSQLSKYVQLKVKVLLAAQNPVDYDYLSPQRFVPNPKPKCIIPTVVLKGEQQDTDIETPLILTPSKKDTENVKKIKRNEYISQQIKNRDRDSSTSTCASDVKVLKEKSNIMTRLVTAKSLKSDDSLKSGRSLRKQKSQIGTLQSGGVSVRNLRSAGRRPHSGSVTVPGTNTTIQKKKKDKDTVRCQECRKKIGVACRYQCRCGKLFCSTHRYAETHNCTYDYKTEGRREITEANPLIVATKVDKI